MFSCSKSFKIEHFGLAYNCNHNLHVAKAEPQCKFNEPLIRVFVLVLSGDCIVAFGDHFFFDSRLRQLGIFCNFEPWHHIAVPENMHVADL